VKYANKISSHRKKENCTDNIKVSSRKKFEDKKISGTAVEVNSRE